MTQIKLLSKFATFKADEAYVIGVRNNNGTIETIPGYLPTDFLEQLNLSTLGVTGAAETITRLAGPNKSVICLVGVGKEEIDEDNLREFAGVATRNLSEFKSITFDLPTEDKGDLQGLIEGALLGLYKFSKYKSDKTNTRVSPANVSVLTSIKMSGAELGDIQAVIDSVYATKDLVNTPPNDLYPEAFARIVKERAKGLSLKVQVFDESALEKGGFGGILAVGKGSSRGPRLVKIAYHGAKAKTSIALVGKGITFDSGGLSLKPAESMVGMKYDMTGAATVFETVIAIAKLKLEINVTAWLCLAENMPSGAAARPNDVITIRNGKTVEVLNTDAEGRLVLADGLSAASEEFPDLIIDVATLTGAATIALGNRYAGLMGDSEAISSVEAAAFDAGELVWHMPLPQELRSLLNSEIADVANVKIGNRAGGMLIGGLFLRDFIGYKRKSKTERISWAHLDIAGPANNDAAPYGYTGKGGTGAYLRTLVSLAKSLSR